MRFDAEDALIVVDLQRDFCAGGRLEVAGADEIVPLANALVADAASGGATLVASRDWHPEGHASFAAQGGPWPRHCVQHSAGAQFHRDLRLPDSVIEVLKGVDLHEDQASAFIEGLAQTLRRRGVRRVHICGLALDVCVRATALDALRHGFETSVVAAATRPTSPEAGAHALRELTAAGAVIR